MQTFEVCSATLAIEKNPVISPSDTKWFDHNSFLEYKLTFRGIKVRCAPGFRELKDELKPCQFVFDSTAKQTSDLN